MIFLTVEEIISIHHQLIANTGGSDGLRDKGLLESAVFSAYGGYDGVEAYPSTEEKASRLCFSLVSNHAFVDGNKRIGVFVMLVTLKLNDILLEYTQKELIDLGLSLAKGDFDYFDTLGWIKKHIR